MSSALDAAFSFLPLGVFLAYIHYATALPPGLLDAARLDGCGELQAFLRIAVPLAKGIIALIVCQRALVRGLVR